MHQAAGTAAADMTAKGAGAYRVAPINALVPSKTNPRTHFDDAYIGELARSIADKGLIQPIVVRPLEGAPLPTLFEIVAGECRFLASKRAGMLNVPVIVREMTDGQVLEAQLEENIHRKDLTPLEEAAGYRRLIASNPDKHSAESIATRIGMSVGYVWDRLKLNDLVPEAKNILEHGLMTVGHAILISRQKPDQQTRIINPRNEALFERQRAGRIFDEAKEKPGKFDDVKAVSVRELEGWIARHVRFDVDHAAQAVPFEFEETAAAVAAAAGQPGRGKKVIAITFDHGPADDAKDPNERTYGVESWRRADGAKKAPPRMADAPECEHSVLGVVTVGREMYGQTLLVCIARDKCLVHFGDVIKAREKAAKQRESGQEVKAKKTEDSWQAQERKRREEEAKKEVRWKVFHPALKKAAAEKLRALKSLNGPQYAAVLEHVNVPASTKPADLPKAILVAMATALLSRGSWYEKEMVAVAKLLGIDVKSLEPKVDAATPAPAKKAAKKR